MDILITGGYGFIGSHVAEKFYREGYRIYIIDNLSAGNVKNINFKHTFFQLDIEDPQCDEVMRRHKFDMVIHLAAQINVVSSLKDPYQDTRSNILGLTNMLQLSAKYGVKKFVFASSAAVYGNNQNIPLREEEEEDPLSPYGMSKLIGEYYCKKWKDLYGLDTICFRFSNVYGPRQGTIGEGGVVSIFLQNLAEGKEIQVFGDGNQTRDFIFVKDIADGIYNAVHTDNTGVYNLSTNTENSVNHILKVLGSYCSIQKVVYKEPREGDIKHSCLDNTKIRSTLDWTPKYTLEEGLKKTYTWYIDDYKQNYKDLVKGNNKSSSASIKKLMESFKKKYNILAYLENFLIFFFICFLTIVSQNSLNQYTLDFKLIYIVIIGVVYGLKQSVLASLLSCFLYIFLYFQQGRRINFLLQDTNSLLQLSFYMLIGIVVGYMIDSKNNELHTKDKLLQSTEEKYAFLNKMYDETLMVKEELCHQIISTQDSYGKVYSILMQLEGLEIRDIFSGSVAILEDIVKSDKVSIYSLSDANTIAILSAKSDDKDFVLRSVVKVKDRADIQQVIETKEIFINRELLPHLPIMSAPIIANGEVIAVASVYNVGFENLTLHRQNLFSVATNLISYSLRHVYIYIHALEDGYSNYPITAEVENLRVKQTTS